jgi:hypothetical protein
MKQLTKILLVIFCLTNSLVVLGQKNDPQLKLLTKAYKKNSAELMSEFLNNWIAEVPPMSEDEFLQLNDTIREAYKLYSQIHSSGVFANELWITAVDTIFFSTTEEVDNYVLEQIKKYDTENEYQAQLDRKINGKRLSEKHYWHYEPTPGPQQIIINRSDNITDFRPFLPNQKRVYILNKKYGDIIYKFSNTPKSLEEKRKRCEFLNKYVSAEIRCNPFGCSCRIMTNRTHSIKISKDLKTALANYSTEHSGWIVCYIKKGGYWVKTREKRTWIE